jgi:hypothetical protein
MPDAASTSPTPSTGSRYPSRAQRCRGELLDPGREADFRLKPSSDHAGGHRPIDASPTADLPDYLTAAGYETGTRFAVLRQVLRPPLALPAAAAILATTAVLLAAAQ